MPSPYRYHKRIFGRTGIKLLPCGPPPLLKPVGIEIPSPNPVTLGGFLCPLPDPLLHIGDGGIQLCSHIQQPIIVTKFTNMCIVGVGIYESRHNGFVPEVHNLGFFPDEGFHVPVRTNSHDNPVPDSDCFR